MGRHSCPFSPIHSPCVATTAAVRSLVSSIRILVGDSPYHPRGLVSAVGDALPVFYPIPPLLPAGGGGGGVLAILLSAVSVSVLELIRTRYIPFFSSPSFFRSLFLSVPFFCCDIRLVLSKTDKGYNARSLRHTTSVRPRTHPLFFLFFLTPLFPPPFSLVNLYRIGKCGHAQEWSPLMSRINVS